MNLQDILNKELAVTFVDGYAIIKNLGTQTALVTEPTMLGDGEERSIIAFVIVAKCDDYQEAALTVFALNESGRPARDHMKEPDAPAQESEPQQIEAGVAAPDGASA